MLSRANFGGGLLDLTSHDFEQSGAFSFFQTTMSETSVILVTLPERLIAGQAHKFCRRHQRLLKSRKSRVVFDFSKVRKLDTKGIGALLYCAEEVIKRNGDIKFAAVPAEIEVLLALTNMDTLFEIFETVGDAVESYSPPMPVSLSPSELVTNALADGSGAADSKVAA